MLRFLLLCNILCLPSIAGTHITKVENIAAESSKKTDNTVNQTNTKILSEGGLISEITSSIILPKDEVAGLPTSNSKIVPRKGADYKKDKNISDNKPGNTSIENGKPDAALNKLHNGAAVEQNVSKDTSLNVSSTLPKKPPVLSFEALANSQVHHASPNSPAVKLSHTILTSDEMQPPNKENGSNLKTHTMSTNRHPGMIMPVIITILVVPMFAVLGYLALRRGQEAWKNRHYKRMDFLLDGMYND